MRTAESLRAVVISAMMGAVALVLPPVFHLTGLGSKLLPMLLPLLLNGFLVPFPWAAFTGLAVPWISALTTGMPPLFPPMAAVVSVEGAVLGGVASALYRRGRGWLWLSLTLAILSGRAASFAAMWILARMLHLPAAFASIGSLIYGIPGVILQFVTVPLVLRLISRNRGLLFPDER